MYIKSEVMNGGLVPDRFGKHGEYVNENGMPIYSVSCSAEDSIGYGGMAPPNAPHTYTLKVYALATAEVEGTYNN